MSAMSMALTSGFASFQSAMSRLMNSASSISPLTNALYVSMFSFPNSSRMKRQELFALVRVPSMSKMARSYFFPMGGQCRLSIKV